MKNQFRAELIVIPTTHVEYGAKIRAVLPRLIPLTRALFLENRCLDLQSLSTAIFPNANVTAIDTTFYKAYTELVDAGRILTSQTGNAGAGHTPFAFDLTREKPFRATGSLQTLLAAYQTSSASESAKRAAMAATRVLLALDTHSSTENVLKAAKQIPFDALHGLADRFAANALNAGTLNRKTIANFTSALRAVLTFGLREDLFPLYFPAFRPIDAWTDLVDTTFPLAVTGETDGGVRKARCGLFTLFAEARDALHVSDPSALTAEDIDTAAQHLRAPQRDADLIKVAGLKKVIDKANGDWAHPVIRLVVDTLESRRPVPGVSYLRHNHAPQHPVTTLPGFLDVLKSHNFGNEWSVFFHWYLEYSSLDWRAIDARPSEFPPRPPVRELATDTFQTRLRAVRAYLGAARALYPDCYWELSPKDVFGPMYRELTGSILNSWELAAKNLHSVSHRASAGLHHIVCDGGMLARALFDLDVHCRAPATANKETTNTSARAFVDRERVRPDRTSIEVSLLDAYEYSRTVCLNLQGERKTCPTGSGINTVKNLRKAIHETPFWKFQHAQHELLRQVEQRIANGTALNRDGLALTVATLVHGILVSGGCRQSEVCHLREGLQTHLAQGIRLVTLRAADRKNEKMHPFALRDLWLPDWFLQHYLEKVRSVINRHDITDPSTPPFLVLNPHAQRPYGCPEELPDGSGRDKIKFKNSKKQIGKIWKKNVALAFVALKFEVPFEPHQFGMHIVRNVGGHAVFVTKGLEAAAHFLGDSVGTVEESYSALKGELVDTSLLVGP